MRSAVICIALIASPVASALAESSAPSPSFADVLAAPDDPAVNIAYARAQIAAGNMLYAAAAYERLLLERPDQDAIRLDYVDVLLNLDDGAAAGREIGKLDGLKLQPDQQAHLAALHQRLLTITPVAQ